MELFDGLIGDGRAQYRKQSAQGDIATEGDSQLGALLQNAPQQYGYDDLRNSNTETYRREQAVLAERERCAGIVRSAIRESARMMGVADIDWYRSMFHAILVGINPEEGKVSLSREQEMKDAVAEAEMNERERCAKIVDEYLSSTGRACASAAIIALMGLSK